jgi:HD-GYP domain-containing protein (c-di-GMP phosphodiesterase class II)
VGCTAESHLDAEFWGDEVRARREITPALLGSPAELFATAVRNLEATSDTLRAGEAPRSAPLMRDRMSGWAEGHCEVSAMLAERLALGIGVKEALTHLYERWDGNGFPGRIRGEEVPLPVRVMQVAHDADLYAPQGLERAVEVVRERAGHGLDPSVADAFLKTASESLAAVEAPSIWEALLAAEPGRRPVLAPGALDIGLGAIADFTDMKSPYFGGHSAGVARLAGEAATRLGLSESDRDLARRAGLVHDVGRVAVPSLIWGKPDVLTRDELERVRLHPYQTERVLASSALLAPIGRAASLHHERLDGSGYHRGLSGVALTPVARLLAAADAYHAMTEPRPHRDALEPEQAAEALAAEVRQGRLDADAGSVRASGRGALPARARARDEADCSPPRHLSQDGRPSHPAHLHEGGRVDPGRGNPVRTPARPRVRDRRLAPPTL